MDSLKKLLSEIDVIRKHHKEIELITGSKFNVFKIVGLTSEEVRMHSKFIAELLNPKGSHGQGDTFLKAFIQTMLPDFVFDEANSKVSIEFSVGEISKDGESGGRIDILIKSVSKAIIIENKVYAGDQKNQLIRYKNYAERENLDYKILYLTLEGKEASEFSAGKGEEQVKYIPISYKDDIINWLTLCRKEAAEFPLLREGMSHYINLIKHLTNQSTSKLLKMDIVKLITKNPENLSNARVIAQNFNAAKIALQKKFWSELVAVCRSNELIIDEEVVETINKNVEDYYAPRTGINKFTGISIKVGNLPSGELVRYNINVHNNTYMGFVFEDKGKKVAAENEKYKQHIEDIKKMQFKTSTNFIGWQYTEPKLNFVDFNTDTPQIADGTKMTEVVEGIVGKVKKDIAFAKDKWKVE